jgi:uncharacterized protein (TIGR02996 family)
MQPIASSKPTLSDEAAFLNAVRAAPSDQAPRLVYADWLDERADPRGELIRVEEEMRSLPAFADRYWELKPRRNGLRERADPDWLAALGYGTVVRPLFGHGVPDDWKGRWRLIREFVERWHGIPMGDIGGQADKVREAEARLGQTLPPAVREWVAFAQDLDVHAQRDHILYDIYSLDPVSGGAFCLARDIHEPELGWAVLQEDHDRPDPPVYYFALNYGRQFPHTGRTDRVESVTEYVLTNVWGRTPEQGHAMGVDVEDPAPLIRDLEATFPSHGRFKDVDIFEMDDILVQLYRGGKGLEVEVAWSLPREAVPAFLWTYAHGGGRFRGMFLRERPRTG